MAVSLNSRSWSSIFSKSYDDFNGYVNDFDTALELIKKYEIETTATFVGVSQTKAFGRTDKSTAGELIMLIHTNLNMAY